MEEIDGNNLLSNAKGESKDTQHRYLQRIICITRSNTTWPSLKNRKAVRSLATILNGPSSTSFHFRKTIIVSEIKASRKVESESDSQDVERSSHFPFLCPLNLIPQQ